MSAILFILSSWMQQLDTMSNQHLGYLLDTRYPSSILSRRALKDRDQLVVTQLENVCNEVGFYICLANMTRTVSGAHDGHNGGYDGGYAERRSRFHTMGNVHSTSLTLDQICELDGSVPYDTKSLKFDEDNIVQLQPFENDCEEPDEDHYDGYYGNLTHEYRKTVSTIRSKTIASFC